MDEHITENDMPSKDHPLDAASVGLLPCPFCEDDVIVTDSQECEGAETYYWHRCAGCGVESEGMHGYSASRDQWNQRPHVAPIATPAAKDAVEASGSETYEDALESLSWIENVFPGQGDATDKGITKTGWRRLDNACATIRKALTRPQPSGETREAVARIIASEFLRQDYEPDAKPEDVTFSDGLSWSYVDQGRVDFGEIADRVIAYFARAEALDEGAAGEPVRAAITEWIGPNVSWREQHDRLLALVMAAIQAHPSPTPAETSAGQDDRVRRAVEALEPFAALWGQIGDDDRARRAWRVNVTTTTDAVRKAIKVLAALKAEGK